ncbi:MAG: hypothetical protein LBQ66_09980 [Planctomycetaceae bacterium]|nr:hypothetical protein [Planctomycetaceae bacterium]
MWVEFFAGLVLFCAGLVEFFAGLVLFCADRVLFCVDRVEFFCCLGSVFVKRHFGQDPTCAYIGCFGCRD